MRRREFIILAGSTTAWPIAAHAQQAVPVVGFLSGNSAGERSNHLEAFRQGLIESGYTEGRNVTIEYRYADHQIERLRPLAKDLLARGVAVITAVGGNNSALVAKSLTSTIPIVFTSGVDPVRAGLVSSINRPGNNVTGVTWFSAELGSKHIELMNELAPQGAVIALLMNPNNPEAEFYAKSAQDGAHSLKRQLLVLKAGTSQEINVAFAILAEQRARGVMIAGDPYFPTRARQFAILAARYAIPMISTVRDFPEAGGLISYGNSVIDAYRKAGIFVGRILEGAAPAELAVDRAVKFELVINLETAKALGLSIPKPILARADEVIE